MKILYGIQCTGNGHLTRSLKIIDRIKKLGHTVDILLSGKNNDIEINYDVKYRFKGFTFYNSNNGGINYFKTIKSFNIIEFVRNIKTIDIKMYDKVISDFEPFTAWVCKLNKKECYGISNQYSFISKKTPRYKRNILGELILKWFAPVSNPTGIHYEKYDDFIIKPIINDEIINAEVKDLQHYTVYLPSFNLKNSISELVKYTNIFHIFHGDAKYIFRYRNCVIYPLDKKAFINSFINCHGIITNTGFQTSSEALYMGKKLMVIPTIGQYEQECNTCALSKLGVFTGNIKDIKDFINSKNIIFEKWDDPINELLKKIL